MIFYLEKLDITEEKVRLANHCRYFREVATKEEGAGRKLGFIAQEMGREINTMGSKARCVPPPSAACRSKCPGRPLPTPRNGFPRRRA